MLKEPESGLGQQLGADAFSLQVAPHVQILEKGSPRRVDVEHGVCEADDFTACIGDHGVLAAPGRSEPSRPNLETIADDVTLEV